MKRNMSISFRGAALVGTILLFTDADAQQRDVVESPRATAYDATREEVLLGTVDSYTEDSSEAPMGVHVALRTASGLVDVHLGPGAYLRSHHFSLALGESVRLVGATMPTQRGKVFLVRIAQHGARAIAVRSANGLLLANSAARGLQQAERATSEQQRKPR